MSQSSTPIRVGIIGLSASAVASWAADAHLPALLSPEGQELFKIVALCNSSVSAAEAAVKHFNLPESVKTYGNAQDLADDPDIDLVVCSTRVDRHFAGVSPSIKAGKDVFVEWPVASDPQTVTCIADLAVQANVKIAVGLQGRFSPPVLKIKEILETRDVGKVLSSDIHIAGGTVSDPRTLGTGWEYFADKKVGGNNITILFGHAIDQVQSVLGSYVRGSTRVRAQVQYPDIQIVSSTGEVVDRVVNNVPDLLHVSGELTASRLVVQGATLTSSYRKQWPIPGQSTLAWTIECERASIFLGVSVYPSLQADAYSKPVTIRIKWFEDGTVEEIDWDWSMQQKHVPVRARGTFFCLQAFAQGREDGWVDVRDVNVLSEQLAAWTDGRPW